MSFRLVPKLVTLNDPERRNWPNGCVISPNSVEVVEDTRYFPLLLIEVFYLYTVFQKNDAKVQITITTAYLIRIKYPLNSLNYHLSDVHVANFNKIPLIVSQQQLF